MAGNAAMTIFIGADNSDFLKKMASTERALKKGFGNAALGMSEGIATALAGATVAMGVAGLACIKMAGDFQASKKSFEVFLGSAEKAEDFVGKLSKFAADTPFELPGLMNASKKLMAFKFAAEDIIPIMSVIGDTSAMLNTGQEGIDSMVRTFGQMQAKGKVQAEEVMQLAEAGVNAWQYLAAAMGTTVSGAMEKVTAGEVDAQKGINAILLGMQKDFKGGMDALSKEIPGLFSTIKDNVGAVAKSIGNSLIEAFDIKTKMQKMADYLGSFADYVKSCGLNAALKNLIPKELSLAVFLLGGAILGAAVPAMIAFGIATWTALAPLLPFIAAGMGLAAVAWVIWQAWDPLGDLFKNAWTAASAWTMQKWAEIKIAVYSGVKNVLQSLEPLLSIFGGGIQGAISGWMADLASKVATASDEATLAAAEANAAAGGVKAALSGVGDSLVKGAQSLSDSVGSYNKTFEQLHGGASEAGAKSKDGTDKAAKEWEKLEKKAEQVSKSIQSDWVSTTKTQQEQLDYWMADQLEALNESAAANENYQRDRQRLEETYAEKRRKIMLAEAKTIRDIQEQMRNLAREFSTKKFSFNLKGSNKGEYDIVSGTAEQIRQMEKDFGDLAEKWDNATQSERDAMAKAMKESGILFQVSEDGKISFAREAARRRAEIERQSQEKMAEYVRSGQALQDDLDAARREGNLQEYAAMLESESALFQQDLTGRQEMIDVYYQIWKDSHRSAMSYMAEMIQKTYEGLTTMFTDVFSGTKSLSEAWSDFGKSMVQMIAKIAAQWVSSRIMMAIFGKSMMGQQTAVAAATGAAVAAAWAPAAAMVSLATFGANSAPAMAGIAATNGMAIGLSGVPALASGGITTGPTLAEIGEGHRQETVLPLDRKVFERMGLVDNEPQRGGDVYHIAVQAWDGPSVDRWLDDNGHKLVKTLKRQGRAFAGVGG